MLTTFRTGRQVVRCDGGCVGAVDGNTTLAMMVPTAATAPPLAGVRFDSQAMPGDVRVWRFVVMQYGVPGAGVMAPILGGGKAQSGRR